MIIVRIALALLLGLGASCGGSTSHESGEHVPAGGPGVSATGGRAPGAHQLKVASWNLEWLNRSDGTGPVKRVEADYARLRRYANELDADVIALQEVDGVEAARRVFDASRYQLFVAEQNNPQRTGFAVRRGVVVERLPDYRELDVGQVRVGVDIAVTFAGRRLRLLSVHLKSACFSEPASSETRDCKKLFQQLPVLEAWIDARAEEGVAALVLGDFNRRLFAQPNEPFWSELDDGVPALSDLWSPTEGRRSICWGSRYPDFIDHLVLNQAASALALGDSFVQQRYHESDAANKRVLSDHCPLAIVLDDGVSSATQKSGEKSRPDAAAEPQRIKGNIGAHQRKIYHAPDCPDYARTKIDESKHERWFSTRSEAEAAGFQKASNCP
jgi:endonuclease/exonuclease/phosphatase family metal-dependent hydrolase